MCWSSFWKSKKKKFSYWRCAVGHSVCHSIYTRWNFNKNTHYFICLTRIFFSSYIHATVFHYDFKWQRQCHICFAVTVEAESLSYAHIHINCLVFLILFLQFVLFHLNASTAIVCDVVVKPMRYDSLYCCTKNIHNCECNLFNVFLWIID